LYRNRAAFDRDFGRWRIRGRRRHRRRLPPGGHRRRAGMHGRARGRALSGGAGRDPRRGGMKGERFGARVMDWDKLKVFHAAGEQLGLSQSAVSRQVSALEQELSVPLFHRHARGLILTEQGDLLYRTAHDVFMKLEAARTKLTDSREKPNGELRVNTTAGIGV